MKRILGTVLAGFLVVGNVSAQTKAGPVGSRLVNKQKPYPAVVERKINTSLIPQNLTAAVLQGDVPAVQKFLKTASLDDFAIGYKYEGKTYRTYLYCVAHWPLIKDLVTVKGAVPISCPPKEKGLKNYVLDPQQQAANWPEYDLEAPYEAPRVLLSAKKVLSCMKEGFIAPNKIARIAEKNLIPVGYDEDHSRSNAGWFIINIGFSQYLPLLKQVNVKMSFDQWSQLNHRFLFYAPSDKDMYAADNCSLVGEVVEAPKFFPQDKWNKYVKQLLCNQGVFKIDRKTFVENLANHDYDKLHKQITDAYNNRVLERADREDSSEKALYKEMLDLTKAYTDKYHQYMQDKQAQEKKQAIEDSWQKAFPNEKFAALRKQLRKKYGDEAILDKKIRLQVQIGSQVDINVVKFEWRPGGMSYWKDDKIFTSFNMTFTEPVAVVLYKWRDFEGRAGYQQGDIYREDGKVLKHFGGYKMPCPALEVYGIRATVK